MAEHVALYPAVEHAIRSGALLVCEADVGKPGPGRIARLWSEQTKADLAIGLGHTLPEALHALEQDLLSASPVGPHVSEHSDCWVCAMNAFFPVVSGSAEAVSALDGHLLARRSFEVKWQEGRFHFTSRWVRAANRLTPEMKQQLREEKVPIRWRHGEYVWEVTPLQHRKTGAWDYFSTRSVSRPPGSKGFSPSEPWQVAVEAGTLAGVLAAAEERLAAEQRDEEEWLRQIVRVS